MSAQEKKVAPTYCEEIVSEAEAMQLREVINSAWERGIDFIEFLIVRGHSRENENSPVVIEPKFICEAKDHSDNKWRTKRWVGRTIMAVREKMSSFLWDEEDVKDIVSQEEKELVDSIPDEPEDSDLL